jgi:hypothetical protein
VKNPLLKFLRNSEIQQKQSYKNYKGKVWHVGGEAKYYFKKLKIGK